MTRAVIMTSTLGSRSGARSERVLAPGFLDRRWKPGQSGNPSGQTAEYGDVVRLAQSLSLRAIERLGELVESEDERVAAPASSAILDRAFGKPQPNRLEQDSLTERLARMTPAERVADAVALAERVRRGLGGAAGRGQGLFRQRPAGGDGRASGGGSGGAPATVLGTPRALF